MSTTSIPTGAIAKPGRALFALALDAQEIDGELALAMAMLSSEDEEERQQGEEFVSALLEQASVTNDILVTKSDQLLEMAQWLQARGAHLRETAKARIEAAAREEAAAAALVSRVAAVLSTLNPGQTSFALPEHKLAGRKTTSVEVTEPGEVPDRYSRLEVKIKVPATGEATNYESLLRDLVEATQGVEGDLFFEKAPDKKLIQRVIQAGEEVPGAALKQSRSWRIA